MSALVQRVAEIIAPSIWGDAFDSTAEGAKPLEPTTRIMYLRSDAICKAHEVLKAIRGLSSDEIGRALVESDIEIWGKLGLKADPKVLRELVEKKHLGSAQ